MCIAPFVTVFSVDILSIETVRILSLHCLASDDVRSTEHTKSSKTLKCLNRNNYPF